MDMEQEDSNMAKYIDAEKLKKLLDTEYTEYVNKSKQTYAALQYQYIADGLDIAEQLIDSLQQDKETLELCSKVWWEEQGWIMIPPDATIEGIDSLLKQVRKRLQQEQSEVDLENEFADFLEKENAYVDDNNKISYYNGSSFDHTSDIYPIARHFYELGRNSK